MLTFVTAIPASTGPDTRVARAIGADWKGWSSIGLYLLAVPLAYLSRVAAVTLYVAVIALWLVPDRRLAKALERTSR